jgi:hypothetical protein
LKEANYSIEHTLEIKTWLEQKKQLKGRLSMNSFERSQLINIEGTEKAYQSRRAYGRNLTWHNVQTSSELHHKQH